MRLLWPDAIWDLVSPEPNTGHWLWLGRISKARGIPMLGALSAVRAVYQLCVDLIPDGHAAMMPAACRELGCVAPYHVRIVDSLVRAHATFGASWESRAEATHCAHGHPWTDENTRWSRQRGRNRRQCRACARERGRDQR